MRVYFEKPRTTTGWKGLINDPHLDGSGDVDTGLRTARELLLEVLALDLPIGCEFLDPITPQYISDTVAWGAIGARTTESQVHRQLGSGLSMPVGFKNRTDGNVQVAVDAVRAAAAKHSFAGVDFSGTPAILHTAGNPDGHVILRGGDGVPNHDPAGVAAALAKLRAAGLPERVVIDASHANSGKDHERQPRGRGRDRRAGRRAAAARSSASCSSPSSSPAARSSSAAAADLRPVDHRRLHRLGHDRRACSTGSPRRSAPAARRRRSRPRDAGRPARRRAHRRVDRAGRARRLGAHVVGWNRSPAALETALRNGAIDEAVASARRARRRRRRDRVGVRRRAARRGARALRPRCPGAVVTRRRLDEAGARRGGRPRAASSAATRSPAPSRRASRTRARTSSTARRGTSRRASARPACCTSASRASSRASARCRPRSRPADHDRLMAAVSHLPHVVANLLVAQAADALGGETLPATGPELSRRDARRGRQPGAVGADLPREPRRARRRRSTISCARLGEVRALLDAAAASSARWQAARRRAARARCSRSGSSGGAAARDPRVGAQPARASSRRSRSRSAARASTSPTCRSRPEADNRTGIVALWVRAGRRRARDRRSIAELGYPAA